MARYKATRIIDEAFNDEGIHHDIEQHGDSESVCAGFAIPKGPLLMMRFISRDNDNDVAVRILSLFNDIPKNEWPRTLRAINKVNCEMRYVKFSLDDDGDINVEFDIPVRCSDDCLGRVACELFYRIARIVREKYEMIVRALYLEDDEEDEDEDAGEDDDTLDMSSLSELLQRFREKPDDESVETDPGDADEAANGADGEDCAADEDDDNADLDDEDAAE